MNQNLDHIMPPTGTGCSWSMVFDQTVLSEDLESNTHGLLFIYITLQFLFVPSRNTAKLYGKFSLIDLAGKSFGFL